MYEENLEKLKKQNEELIKEFDQINDDKEKIINEAKKKVEELTNTQKEINTNIIKNNGKIELLEESSEDFKNKIKSK